MARTAHRTEPEAARATKPRSPWMHALEPLPMANAVDVAGPVHQLEPLRPTGSRRMPLKPEPRRRRDARI